jgi:ABC-type Fe3+-siderophore transport system permease subunit
MMSLPAIIGISLGAAGIVAFGRKTPPWSTFKKIWVFIVALIGMLAILLAINFAIFYSNHP